MKALIHRTSSLYEETFDAPIAFAERVETGIYDQCAEQYKFVWMVEVQDINDLKSISLEAGEPLIISFPENKEYGEDLDIEIYDNYRE